MFTLDGRKITIKCKSFDLFPLPAIVVFNRALSSMRCSEKKRAAETGLECIFVHIHPALDLSCSKDSQLGPAGGKTSDRLSIFHRGLM